MCGKMHVMPIGKAGLLGLVDGEAVVGDDFFRVDVDLEKAGFLRAVVVGGGGFEGQDVAVQGAGVADARGVVVDDFADGKLVAPEGVGSLSVCACEANVVCAPNLYAFI